MANKHFIISLDAGYNGFKTIVGEKPEREQSS